MVESAARCLVCRNCGRTEEVEAPNVEKWARSVAADHGFVDLDHELELFGVCPQCAADRSGAGHDRTTGRNSAAG